VTAREQRAAARAASSLEDLLGAIIACGEVHLVVKNAGATAELRGEARLSIGEEWLTIELVGTPDHLHVRRAALTGAEFLTEASKNRGVCFLAEEGQPVLTCRLPGTAEGRPGYSAERRAAFDALEASDRGALWRRRSEAGS